MTTKALYLELKTRYKEYFESKLAITLLEHAELFPSVHIISAAVVKLIQSHHDLVLKQIENDPKIKKELYNTTFFGRFNEKERRAETSEHILNTILKILTDKQADLSQVMQVQVVFIQWIYDVLVKHPERNSLENKIFNNDLFNARVRVEKKTTPLPTTQLGIVRNPVFCKKIGKSREAHVRAVDHFVMNSSQDESIGPYVAGASGHTGEFMLGALLFGNLNKNELQQYTLACFAFLAAGGNHSFHEVFSVAKMVGVMYHQNNYVASIPDSIKQSGCYKELMKQFPEFLSEGEISLESQSAITEQSPKIKIPLSAEEKEQQSILLVKKPSYP